MGVKTCEVCGAGFAQSLGRPSKRCPAHRSRGGKYGREHQKLRAALAPSVPGTPCHFCRKPILSGQPWDLDHTEDGQGWRGPSHAACNRADGGRRSRGATAESAPLNGPTRDW